VPASRVPFRVRPMLATLVSEPFHLPGWVYEEKYDGYRVIAYKEGRHVTLLTRNLKDRTADFPGIAGVVARLPATTLAIDGEIVIFDATGISRFQLLQRRDPGDAGRPPVFVAFDCLYARGKDLRSSPLVERHRRLRAEARENRAVRIARRLDGDGFAAFESAKRLGLEGLVAKDESAPYEAGRRSLAWRKVKVRNEEEFVIGGFTRPAGSRMHFGALLVGAWDRGQLHYAGRVGTGFTGKTLGDLLKRMKPLARPTSPFVDVPRERDVTWLEPELVAQIAFTELTSDRRLRHPAFLGLREDKPAREVRWPRSGAAPDQTA
jgi:bifunctional non-homologous end joining protein LigD